MAGLWIIKQRIFIRSMLVSADRAKNEVYTCHALAEYLKCWKKC